MPDQLMPDHFRHPVIPIAALLVVAIVLGGGGVAYGWHNLAVQLLALGLIACNRAACGQFWRQAPMMLRVLMIATLLVPLLQLIPLPFALWTQLPGRELAAAGFMASGGAGWHPFSLDPARTLVAALGLITPVAVLMLGWRLTRRELGWLAMVVVALGLFNFALGVPQVISGGTSAIFYPENPMPGVLFGSFANRNSTGLFLVVCLTLTLLAWHGRMSAGWQLARFGLAVLMVVGIILTQSRSAIVLMAIPLALSAMRWLAHTARARRIWLAAGAGGVALLLALALTAGGGTRIGTALERFQASSDARSMIWEDAAYAAHRYWPLGAGMGTFDEVFQADESLEHLSPRKAGRAHNDYLELAIEAGLPGMIMLAAWLIWMAYMAAATRKSGHHWQAWAGGAILLAIALQSISDYPLRNQAMLALAALAVSLLLNNKYGEGGR